MAFKTKKKCLKIVNENLKCAGEDNKQAGEALKIEPVNTDASLAIVMFCQLYAQAYNCNCRTTLIVFCQVYAEQPAQNCSCSTALKRQSAQKQKSSLSLFHSDIDTS